MDNPGYILVDGDANCDVLIYVPENGMENARPPELALGGTGGNTVVALARLGLPCKLMWGLGEDYYGRFILSALQNEGVDTSAIYISPTQASSQVILLLDSAGTPIGDFPLGDHIIPPILDRERQVITQARWLHTEGCTVLSADSRRRLLDLVDTACQANIPYSFDLNLRFHGEMGSPAAMQAIRHIIRHARVVLGSAREFLYLEPCESPIEAAKRLLANERQVAVIRNGPEGSTGVQGERVVQAPAFRVPVIDSLGAGDVYNAGFILAQLEGLSLEDCLRWGNAAAALQISRAGGRRGGATRQQLLDFLASQDHATTNSEKTEKNP